MKTATFSCPHCLSPLRIRDRAFVDREIDCPECGERIEIQLGRDREPVARKVASEEPVSSEKRTKKNRLPPKTNLKRKPKSKSPAKKDGKKTEDAAAPPRFGHKPLFDLGARFSGVPEVLLSPVGIAWSVAGVVALTLLVIAWPGGGEDSPTPADQVADSETSKNENAPDEPGGIAEEIPLPEPPAGIAPLEGNIQEQLQQFGTAIDLYAGARGHFPVGTVGLGDQPVKDRFRLAG